MTTAIAAPEYGTEAWEADRANYIGASDVSAILGVSPFGSAYDVWASKKLGIKPEPSEAMMMGHLLEPVAASLYSRRFPDITLETRGTVAHPHAPWLRATIDRMATGPHGQFPLEIKSTSQYMAERWGDEGSDHVPDSVLVQVQTQLLVLDMPVAHVAVLIGGNTFRAPYVIEADREVQEMIFEQCEEFHTRFLAGDEEPPIAGPNAELHIKRKYATHSDLMLEAPAAVDTLIQELAQAKRDLDDAETREKAAKLQLMEFIGSSKGVVSRYGRVTWSETRGRESVDAKGLIAHLNVPADVVQSFTKVGAPFRTFRFTAK